MKPTRKDPNTQRDEILASISVDVIEGVCLAYGITPAQLSNHDRAVEICCLAMRERGLSTCEIADQTDMFPSQVDRTFRKYSQIPTGRRGLQQLENLWREIGTICRLQDGPRHGTATLIKTIKGGLPPRYIFRAGDAYRRSNQDDGGDWLYTWAGFDMDFVESFIEAKTEEIKRKLAARKGAATRASNQRKAETC